MQAKDWADRLETNRAKEQEKHRLEKKQQEAKKQDEFLREHRQEHATRMNLDELKAQKVSDRSLVLSALDPPCFRVVEARALWAMRCSAQEAARGGQAAAPAHPERARGSASSGDEQRTGNV